MIKTLNEWLFEYEHKNPVKCYDIYTWMKSVEDSFSDYPDVLDNVIDTVLLKIKTPVAIAYDHSDSISNYSNELYKKAVNLDKIIYRDHPLCLFDMSDYLLLELVNETTIFCKIENVKNFKFTKKLDIEKFNDIGWLKTYLETVPSEYVPYIPMSNETRNELKARIAKNKFDL